MTGTVVKNRPLGEETELLSVGRERHNGAITIDRDTSHFLVVTHHKMGLALIKSPTFEHAEQLDVEVLIIYGYVRCDDSLHEVKNKVWAVVVVKELDDLLVFFYRRK